ncbi:MAG: T9SS type A sorting domain-containing protein [Candidatus Zhuqueibacterota bacterium]
MAKRVTVFLMSVIFIMTAALALAQVSPSKIAPTDNTYGINYNNGSCIDRAPNGQVLCVWATGDAYNKQVLWSIYDNDFLFWWTPQVLGNGNGDRTTPTVIADDMNHFHATWSDNYTLMYSQFDGTNWTTPTVVWNDTVDANKNSIVIGSDGKIWIAWSTYRQADNVNEWLMICNSTDNGLTWNPPDTLAKDMHPGIISSYFCVPHLAAGPDGKIAVAYREKDTNISAFYQVFYQEYSGGTWTDAAMITDYALTVDCYQASIEYDSKGRLHCAFYTDEVDWPSVDLGQIYYTWKDEGGLWSAPVAISHVADGKADYPAIAIGDNDALYVTYLQNSPVSASGKLQVFAVTSDDRGTTWSDSARISDGTVNMDLRSVSIGKHPRATGANFQGGADLCWIEPDVSEPDGYSLHYGRIPWVETTGVASNNNPDVPTTFRLGQNYPNPFNPTTTIQFDLKTAGHVELTVYSLTGQQVARLANEAMPAGYHRVQFDATGFSSGIYMYKLTTDNFTATRKMLLLQ